MTRDDPQLKVRLSPVLKIEIEAAAKANNRSINAEIVVRLDESLRRPWDAMLERNMSEIQMLISALKRHDEELIGMRQDVKALLQQNMELIIAARDKPPSPKD